MNYKKILLLLTVSSFYLVANESNIVNSTYQKLIYELNITDDKVVNIGAFTDVLIPIKREERRDVCRKVLETYETKNPKVAYHAANCLIYNGYKESAIPLFTKYIYNGYNKKYFNGRIGYGWVHASNWYKIDEKILKQMVNGMDFYEWIKKEISTEVLQHSSNYSTEAISAVLKKLLQEKLTTNPMSKDDKTLLKECSNIKINIENFSCTFDKKDKVLKSCYENNVSSNKLLVCND